MKLYNTLSRKLEDFKPISDKEVGIYSCGPTVYWNQHIGHMYAYTQWDCLVRTFKYLGYKVRWIMNITDVGHMTSDEDTGEDKMEKGAKREGKSVWGIADEYLAQFKGSLKLLNIQEPDVLCRATEHINEQIELIKKIEKNGFTYRTQTGLVFDTSKFPGYADFAKLNLDEQNSGLRVKIDPEKKKPWDFLLWVTNQPGHVMQWDSPWGRGFPGWHIECTAMSIKYLGEQFDIHTGGKEHIPVHHTNEIAQAFGAFGRQTANYWLHNEWLAFDGQKISKSLGNSILVSDLQEKGFDPLALRYLILTSHYRSGLNFTEASLEAACVALDKLRNRFKEWGSERKEKIGLSVQAQGFNSSFKSALLNDLQMPQALAVLWTMVDDKQIDKSEKFELLKNWEKVLGLKLDKKPEVLEIPQEVKDLLGKREKLRDEKKWEGSDEIRKKIESLGWVVDDTKEGSIVKLKK